MAQTTEEQFGQLVSRIKGQGETVAGELVVTAITGIASLLTPVLSAFQQAHPAVVIRFLTDMRLFRLDYGEAHVAIRAGGPPQEPDNVVQPLTTIRMGLYAARSYIARYGMPESIADFPNHRFIGSDSTENRAPFNRWLRDTVPAECISFRVTEPEASTAALKAGVGIGFLAICDARRDPDLVEVTPPQPEWQAPLWIVTHVDLHRTLKVQSFLAQLKAAAAGWNDLCD